MLALAKRPEALWSLAQVQIGGPQPPVPTLANGRHLTGACVVGSEYGPLHREGRQCCARCNGIHADAAVRIFERECTGQVAHARFAYRVSQKFRLGDNFVIGRVVNDYARTLREELLQDFATA